MPKHKRKLRGGIVGAIIGLASLALPFAMDAIGSMGGPSRAEQEAAVREDYYARLAEWDREQAERKAAEQERIIKERNRKQMIENAKMSQADRAKAEQQILNFRRNAALQQKAQARPQVAQQLQAQQRAALQQQRGALQTAAVRGRELEQRGQIQEEQLARIREQQAQTQAARQQSFQQQMASQLKAASAQFQQAQIAPARRIAPTASTTIQTRRGGAAPAEILTALMEGYGLSLRDAKKAYALLV